MATGDTPLHVYDGDIIQLYCPLEAGYVYGEPNSTAGLELDIIRNEPPHIKDFAAFHIIIKKESRLDESSSGAKIFYGSTVHLKHVASDKYLTVQDTSDSDKTVNLKEVEEPSDRNGFRVASPNQDLKWGQELKNDDTIKLESILDNGLMVEFIFTEKMCYKLSMKVTGSVFTVKSHSHNHNFFMKQNPKNIKDGSVILLRHLETDGFLCDKVSSFNTSQNSKLGILEEFYEGSYKTPYGRGFFVIEKVDTTTSPGKPFQYGEQCRIRHLFSLKCIPDITQTGEKISLNEAKDPPMIFQILPVNKSLDGQKVCHSDEIILKHKSGGSDESFFSVADKSRDKNKENPGGSGFHDTWWYDVTTLTLDPGCTLRCQFEVLQVERTVLLDCYYAVGVTAYFFDCWSKKKIYEDQDFENKVLQLRIKINEAISNERLLTILKDTVMNLFSENGKKINSDEKYAECKQIHDFLKDLVNKDNQDSGSETSDKKIDLHIQKRIYEKFLEISGTAGQHTCHMLNELFQNDSEKRQLLNTDEPVTENVITKIVPKLQEYTSTNGTNATEISCAHELLSLLHLLLIKYNYLHDDRESGNTSGTAETNIDTGSTNVTSSQLRRVVVHPARQGQSPFTSNKELFNVLCQLIQNEDDDISYMSAALIFDIYTPQPKSKPASAHNEEIWLLATTCGATTEAGKLLFEELTKSKTNSLNKPSNFFKKLHELTTGLLNEDEKHKVQKVVYDSGLFHIIIERVMQYRIYRNFHAEGEKVLGGYFKILIRVVTLNAKAQCYLFNCFNDFLKFKKVIGHMICLLNEIFYCNTFLCNKLTEVDIENIFMKAITASTTSGYSQLTVVLQTVIEYSDPAAPVQEFIAQLIMRHSEDKLKCIKERDWLQLLKDEESSLPLNIISLLASCTSNQCHFARSVARKLFSFDDLISILDKKDEDINVKVSHRKVPFIRLLTTSYLTSVKWYANELKSKRQFWSCILESFKNFEEITVGNEWSIHQWHIIGNSEEKKKLYIKDIFYIMEGLIPFLSQFCIKVSLDSTDELMIKDLTNIKVCLNQLKDVAFLSTQLLECINKLNSLNQMSIALEDVEQHAVNRTDDTLESDDSRSPSNNQSGDVFESLPKNIEVAELNEKTSCLEAVKILRKLVEHGESNYIPCMKRIHLEEMVLGFFEIIKQKKQELNNKSDEMEECVKTLFDILKHHNYEIIVEVLIVLQHLTETEVPVVAREVIISCNKDCNNRLIIQMHQLLREANFAINRNKLKRSPDSAAIIEPSADSAQAGHVHPLSAIKQRLIAVLDVISLLCSKQQMKMQKKMCADFDDRSNIVSQTSFILFYIAKQWNTDITDLAQKVVQALIDMCTGNYSNQDTAFRGQVIVSINLILEVSSTDENEGKTNLNSLCIELLEVMLEEIDDNSYYLAKDIANQLKIQNLITEMKQSWDQETLTFIKAYHVLRRVADCRGLPSFDELTKELDLDGESKAMLNYCQERSKSIEISYNKNKKLARVYFFDHQDIEIKDKEMIDENIKRTSPQEKLLDLLGWAEAVKLDNNEEKNKLRKNKHIEQLVFDTAKIRHLILTFLTVVINILILFEVKTPSNYNMPGVCMANESYNETCNNSTSSSPMYFQPIWSPDIELWSTVTLTVLGIIHAVLALMMLTEYLARNWGHIRRPKYLSNWRKNFRNFLINQRSKKLKPPEQQEYFEISIMSFQLFYRIFFLIFSIMAWIPIPMLRYFYCGCMLYPFLDSEVMKYILRALKRSTIQLLIVLLLGFVITYIYAVISFALLNNYFSKQNDQFCHNIFECFITVSHLGLLGSNLDIRPSDDYKPSFGLYLGRVVYDLVLYIVIIVLGLNIVIAILVADRFSDVKEHREKVKEDKEKTCFICSKKRTDFEKAKGKVKEGKVKEGKIFMHHVKKEHNMWHYIHFIVYLQKPETHRNALEEYVFDEVTKGSIDFFPLKKAKSLSDDEHHDSKTKKQFTQHTPEHRRQSYNLRNAVPSEAEETDMGHSVASPMEDIRGEESPF